MKKTLLSILLVFALIIGSLPGYVGAQAAGTAGSQAGQYGSFVSGKQVISDMIANTKTAAHPRIIMSEEKFKNLKSHINDGSVTAKLLEELRGEADRYLKEPVCGYDTDDDHLLETSKRIQRRVAALALAYNIFGKEEYATRAYAEMKAACGFKDWSPEHFLDTAEMCTAFAYGYDWLYNWLNPDQRKMIRTSMIEKGLKQVMQDYKDDPGDRERTYYWYRDLEGDNWQLVCTGGTNLAALAIGDEEDAKTIAASVLDYGFKRAYSFVRRAYSTNDGTYIEGLGYWDYATYYLGLQSSALISAAGTDYGLADYEGIRKSAEFVRYMSSNAPKSFSFGDDRESRDTGWAVFLWLGEHLNSPELSAIRLNNIEDDKEFNYLDVLWIDESKQTGAGSRNALDWGAVGACNASFRNTWDESGLVTALHVGENCYKYHGHYDLGSFYIESNGARFFTDLGNENYSLENRRVSYRIKAEGHNTLVINPTKEIDQKEGAYCTLTGFKSGNEAYAITDLTEAYEPSGANKVVRGLKMIKDKKCVVIQDEISLNKPGEIYWFAHTKGSVDVASDGRSAIVTVGSDRLWVGLIGTSGRFSVMDAKPLPTSLKISGATGNEEYRKLAIHLTDTKDVSICVACVPLNKGETRPAWTPAMKAISAWSGSAGSVKASQIVTSAAEMSMIENGKSCRIITSSTGDGKLSYRSSNTAIATVDASGNIKGIKPGTVEITVTASETTNYKSGTAKFMFQVKPSPTYIYTCETAAKGVNITFKKLANAEGYYVYRSQAGGEFQWKKSITAADIAAAVKKPGTGGITVNGDRITYNDPYATTNGSLYQYKLVSFKNGTNLKGESVVFVSEKSTVRSTVRLPKPVINGFTNPAPGSMKVTWGINSRSTGYVIQYATDAQFSNVKSITVGNKDSVTRTITGLTGGRTCYVRVRVYKKTEQGTFYSVWSDTKSGVCK